MSVSMHRRSFVGSLGAFVGTALALPSVSPAAKPAGFVMWHSPGCGCCLEWAKRVEAAFGRKLSIVEANMEAVKRAHGVPADLRSCHTALIGGYVVEGHVPPSDIKRLIAARSRTIRGLAVAGMPAGSPGMDVGHDRKDPYRVVAFGPEGRRETYATH